MSASEAPSDAAEEIKTPDSALLIEFMGVGSAQFNLKVVGAVTPSQMHALAQWLNWKANFDLSQIELQRAQQQAIDQQILAGLKKGQIIRPN